MRRITHEMHYHGCTLDDVKNAIADGAMPRAYAEVVDGRGKMRVSDYLGKADYDEDGNRVEHTYYFDWAEKADILEYLEEDYEGGFYV